MKSRHQFLFMGNRSLLKHRFELSWFYINIPKSLVYSLLSMWYSFCLFFLHEQIHIFIETTVARNTYLSAERLSGLMNSRWVEAVRL